MNLKKLLHIHSWTYFLGNHWLSGGTAWNRGCHKCGKQELAEHGGNQWLYSESDARRMTYKTQEEWDKDFKSFSDRVDKIKAHQ